MKQKQSGGESGVLAWAVHLFTASGAIFALLALRAVEQGEERSALLWLGVALLVDGLDGTLARAAKVRVRIPNIDGAALDLVVDYLTYVFVPCLLFWRGNYLPDSLAFPLTATILVSSLYVFARKDMSFNSRPKGAYLGPGADWAIAGAAAASALVRTK